MLEIYATLCRYGGRWYAQVWDRTTGQSIHTTLTFPTEGEARRAAEVWIAGR